jgi:FkbM family methyltransferase
MFNLNKNAIPLTNVLPLKTFWPRLFKKWKFQYGELIYFTGTFFGFFGSKQIGNSANGNSLVKLNRDGMLGTKGTVIELPRDKVIYRHVRQFSKWESEISDFLVKGLNEMFVSGLSSIALLDIGANAGLISLQTIRRIDFQVDSICVEPISRHAQACSNNLLSTSARVVVHEVALGKSDGVSAITIEKSNQGNASLFMGEPSNDSFLKESVKVRSTKDFIKKELVGYEGIVLKSDTQGFDALILSQIDLETWNLVKFAVVEVWAHASIDHHDVDSLLEMWKLLPLTNCVDSHGNIFSMEELGDFWKTGNGEEKNLYLSFR